MRYHTLKNNISLIVTVNIGAYIASPVLGSLYIKHTDNSNHRDYAVKEHEKFGP